MSENDSTAPIEPDAAAADEPAADPKPHWRDRAFRMRAVAAVAVASVILGAAGGSVATALISRGDHGHHGEPRIGQYGPPPGMPAVPPGGRMRFPGDESDNGADEESSLSRS